MKKQYTEGLMALGTMALIACSESEGISQANLSTDQITFQAMMQNEWNADAATAGQRATSRVVAAANENGALRVQADLDKPLYLLPVEQEGIHVWDENDQPITRGGMLISDVEQGSVVSSRGSKKTSLSDYSSFGVSALYPSSSSSSAYSVLLDNQEATPAVASSSATWHVADAENAKWPMNNELVSFHAYAPHSTKSYSMLSSTADNTNVLTTIHYDASKTDITNQPDLIVATQTGSRNNASANKDVALQFSHALTAVTFAMSSDLADVIGTGANLEKVRLVGIPNQGDCQLMAKDGKHTAASQSWTNINGSETFEFDLSKQNVTAGKDLALTSGKQTLMMIPQKLPSGAKAEFIFKINGNSQTLTVDLAGQSWAAGSSIIYKLSAKAINTLSSTQITYPNTWADYSYPKTAFDVNEAIGLYVVDNNNKVVASNVKVTKAANGTWNMSSKVLKLAKYHYFAYYPYSTTAPTVDATASDATAFFADKVSKWSVKPDQSASSAADLKAQDLQVAMGVVASDASTLTFAMSHQMGLAVLDLAAKNIVKTRKFKNNNYTYYYPNLSGRATSISASDYTDSSDKQTVMASNNFTGNNKPYKTSTANRYIQVVKPGTPYSYSAADQANSPRSAWGSAALGKACSIKVSSAAGVQYKSITTDADFYYLARVYTYTGRVESFTAPANGKYKMECWGASGNTSYAWGVTDRQGNGGYCYINDYPITYSASLYICVGSSNLEINYNNKISGISTQNAASGGGATCITLTNRGELQYFSSYKNEVILVAGAGGGCEWVGKGGAGGGTSGRSGSRTTSLGSTTCDSYGTGGTSNSGGKTIAGSINATVSYDGSFGVGGCGGITIESELDPGAQGGSGWYGGGGSVWAGAAGGGSSYIKSGLSGNTIAGDKEMPAPNGGTQVGQKGDGTCIISQTSF